MSDIPAAVIESLLRLVPAIVDWYKSLSAEEKKSVDDAFAEHQERWQANKDRLQAQLDAKFGEEE